MFIIQSIRVRMLFTKSRSNHICDLKIDCCKDGRRGNTSSDTHYYFLRCAFKIDSANGILMSI